MISALNFYLGSRSPYLAARGFLEYVHGELSKGGEKQQSVRSTPFAPY